MYLLIGEFNLFCFLAGAGSRVGGMTGILGPFPIIFLVFFTFWVFLLLLLFSLLSFDDLIWSYFPNVF